MNSFSYFIILLLKICIIICQYVAKLLIIIKKIIGLILLLLFKSIDVIIIICEILKESIIIIHTLLYAREHIHYIGLEFDSSFIYNNILEIESLSTI